MAVTYEPIATQTLGTAANNITFNSIAASWTDLRLVLVGTAASTGSEPRLVFNADTGSNYSYNYYSGTGTSGTGGRGTAQTSALMGLVGFDTTIPHLIICDIFSYANSNVNKQTISYHAGNESGASGRVEVANARWSSSAAITSVKVQLSSGVTNFSIGTTATLYGIKAA